MFGGYGGPVCGYFLTVQQIDENLLLKMLFRSNVFYNIVIIPVLYECRRMTFVYVRFRKQLPQQLDDYFFMLKDVLLMNCIRERGIAYRVKRIQQILNRFIPLAMETCHINDRCLQSMEKDCLTNLHYKCKVIVNYIENRNIKYS